GTCAVPALLRTFNSNRRCIRALYLSDTMHDPPLDGSGKGRFGRNRASLCCRRMPLLLPRPTASRRRRRWRNSSDGGDSLRGVPDSPQAALLNVARGGDVHTGEESEGGVRYQAISFGGKGRLTA